MTKVLKRGMLRALKRGGAFAWLGHSQWRRQRLLILCFHGISNDDDRAWNPSLFMPPAVFRARMQLLKDSGCHVLPLTEAVARLYDHALPAQTVAITFDDGFYNFYEHAYPILAEYGYPATVYLTTFYCEHNRPIFWLGCRYLLWKGRHLVLPRDESLGLHEPVDLRSPSGQATALKSIRHHAEGRGIDVEGQTRILEELALRVDVDFKELLSKRLLHLLNPNEVTYLAARGVTFELHTHWHYSPRERGAYVEHLRQNRRRIEAMTGSPARHFCYPSGRHRPEVLGWLEEEGVVSATTCTPGLASVQDHRLLLPRLLDHSGVSGIEFESWLSGFGALLRRSTRRPGVRIR